jgi:hypothetical protein
MEKKLRPLGVLGALLIFCLAAPPTPASGQTTVLASNLGIASPARSVAVDDNYVYFFRFTVVLNPVQIQTEVARVPIDGGAVVPLGIQVGMTDPQGIAVDPTYVYWTERGAGPGFGAVKRVSKVPGSNSIQVLASGLTDPFNILADNSHVYWNDNVNHPPSRVCQLSTSNPASPTVRWTAPCGLISPNYLYDLAQDSTYVYFPTYFPGSMLSGGAPTEQIARFLKASLLPPDYLFKFEVYGATGCNGSGGPGPVPPGDPTICNGIGGVDVLAIGADKVFFDIFSFCWDGYTWALRSVAKGGTSASNPRSYSGVALLTKGFSATVNCMTTDNLYVYWSESTGAIRCIPQMGGQVTTLETLTGVPAALVTPITGKGTGKLFWLQTNPDATVDLKQSLIAGTAISPTPSLDLLLGE